MDDNDFLDLSNQNLGAKTLLKILKEKLNVDIIRLDLTGNFIDEDCADYLASFIKSSGCNILSLSVVETRLTISNSSKIFSAIGVSPIIEFYADDNFITPETIKALGDSITPNTQLQVLSLCGCDISSDGCCILASFLPNMRYLSHLRLESNSIYENGLAFLTKVIDNTSILSIEIGDNMIWEKGMSDFLEKIASMQKIVSLDISCNCVNLQLLTRLLSKDSPLSHLSISGCKVVENQVYTFIESVSRSNLKTLIVDGLNFSNIPTSWPSVQDVVFTKKPHFDVLMNAIINCKPLEDVRIGYLELDQIRSLETKLNSDNIHKNVKISLQDFGRTGNCWVLNFPAFSIDSPTDVMSWKGKLVLLNADSFGPVMRCSLFRDRVLSKIDFSSLKMVDEVFAKLLMSLGGHNLQVLDLTDNELTNASLDYLINYFRDSSISELNISKNKITDIGAKKLFGFLQERHERSPRKLEISIKGTEPEEKKIHTYTEMLGEYISNDSVLKELKIIGPISFSDSIKIVQSLKNNSHLTSLVLDSEFCSHYLNPDPPLDPELETTSFDVFKELLHSLTDKKSKCILDTFSFPYLTEVYIYNEKSIQIWRDIEKKLNDNRFNRSHK